jgi:nucleotide-binding universal stress UspA family protein
MTEIRQILCPIDFSETSRHALDHAVILAKWYQSHLTALHVVHAPLFPPPPMLLSAYADVSTAAVPDRQVLREGLLRWLEPAGRAGVKTLALVEDGNVAAAILDQAARRAADLIVMGTHGLSGFERFMLGSVTERVLRKASGPVLTVPPAAETAAQLPYRRILCPVDFSDPSLAAFRLATSLAQEADARLTLLHVIDFSPDEERIVERFDVPEFQRVVTENARVRLEALLTADLREWCSPTNHIAYGKPYRRILEIAAEEGTDLIVIGVHGRNALDLALFGSTTNQVVRRAPCPVLTRRT